MTLTEESPDSRTWETYRWTDDPIGSRGKWEAYWGGEVCCRAVTGAYGGMGVRTVPEDDRRLGGVKIPHKNSDKV